MDYPGPAENRPDRLPLAHPDVHRPRRGDPLRPAGDVLAVAQREGARSFDAPGADSVHRGTQCTFEVLIEEYRLASDPALARLAAIVHAADIRADLGTDPLAPGLLAIGEGGLDAEPDDQRLLERGSFVYDALYAWCRRQSEASHPAT